MNIQGMTAPQLIKVAIIGMAVCFEQVGEDIYQSLTVDNIDELYGDLKEEDYLDDCDSEVRCDGIPTGLNSPSSRHYESEAVAIQVEGVWVGFIYWSGGGKHGEPEAIDWIEDAYFVEATPKVVTAYDFKKVK